MLSQRAHLLSTIDLPSARTLEAHLSNFDKLTCVFIFDQAMSRYDPCQPIQATTKAQRPAYPIASLVTIVTFCLAPIHSIKGLNTRFGASFPQTRSMCPA